MYTPLPEWLSFIHADDVVRVVFLVATLALVYKVFEPWLSRNRAMSQALTGTPDRLGVPGRKGILLRTADTEKDLGTLMKDTTELKETVGELKADVGGVKADVAALKQQLFDIGQKVTLIGYHVKPNGGDSAHDAVLKAIAALSTRIDQLPVPVPMTTTTVTTT